MLENTYDETVLKLLVSSLRQLGLLVVPIVTNSLFWGMTSRTKFFILIVDPTQVDILVNLDERADQLVAMAGMLPRAQVADYLLLDEHPAIVGMKADMTAKHCTNRGWEKCKGDHDAV
jgi:hypothetical protein